MKFTAVEVSGNVPPPYWPPGVPGLVTVTGTVPELATAEAGMLAVTLEALDQVVDIAAPLKFTVAEDPKLEPSTSSVKAELPAAVLGGVSWAIVGVVPGAAGMFAGLE